MTLSFSSSASDASNADVSNSREPFESYESYESLNIRGGRALRLLITGFQEAFFLFVPLLPCIRSDIGSQEQCGCGQGEEYCTASLTLVIYSEGEADVESE